MRAPEPQKVAIITGASQCIGTGLVDGLRRSPALDVERVDFQTEDVARRLISTGDLPL